MRPTKTRPHCFKSRDAAEHSAHCFNVCTVDNARELRVVVEGPDSDWFAMDLVDAIDLGRGYSWRV